MKRAASGNKLRPDAAEIAFRVMQEATGEAPKTLPPSERKAEEKNPVAVKRGKTGGKKGARKGGNARAEKLSAEQRSDIASLASAVRWKKAD